MSKPPFIVRSDGTESAGATAAPGDWTLTLAPCDLTYVRIDHQARLQFEEIEVMISTPFVLEHEGHRHELDPGRRSELGPFLAIYPAELTAASIEGDGALRLAFNSGLTITVPPHPSYEPWQISGPETALVVCMPGEPGTLAVWS